MKIQLLKTCKLTVISVLMTASSYAVSAPVMVFDGSGQLTGIDDITVQGSSWNVSFGKTLTPSIYTVAFAEEATNALTSLFVAGGLFQGTQQDLFPAENFNGCSTVPGAPGHCWVFTFDDTPDPNFNHIWSFNNDKLDQADLANDAWTSLIGVNGADHITVATWTASAVPLPSAVFMFVPALFGLAGFRRRAKRSL